MGKRQRRMRVFGDWLCVLKEDEDAVVGRVIDHRNLFFFVDLKPSHPHLHSSYELFQYSNKVNTLMNLLQHFRRYQQSTLSPKRKPLSTRQVFNDRSLLHSSTILSRSDFNTPQPYRPSFKLAKKVLLPPIYELTKAKILDLQPHKSRVIEKLISHKHKQASLRKVQSGRNNTEMLSQRERIKMSIKTQASMSLELQRLRPVDKYFYRLDNIRLAERLLVARPSADLQRSSLKKFQLQQRHYGSQISRSQDLSKLKTKRRKTRLDRQWHF